MKPSRSWLWLLLLLPLAAGLARLHFDVEVLNLLPADVPAVQGLKLYQQNFANAGELILTVRAPDPETTDAAARELALVLAGHKSQVRQATWQPPWLEHPGQAAELIAHLWLNQPPEIFGELTNRLAPANLAATLAATREQLTTSMSPADIARLSYDPFGLTRLPESAAAGAPALGQGQELFASVDGLFRIVFVQATTELTSYRECVGWLKEMRIIIEQWQRDHPSVTIHYTGRPVFVAEIAGGMERDMIESVLFTAAVIAVLFWLAHRRWKPMLWLLTLLACILAGTLALGALIFSAINVVSLGFAAILLGLAVDYGVVHYQEALASPEAIIPEIRRAIGPSIFWAAVTTISAFLVLKLAGLPGLAQLGSLVALGVALSAFVMLFAFLPPLFRDRLKRRQEQIAAGTWPPPAVIDPGVPPVAPPASRHSGTVVTISIALIAGAVGVLLFQGAPQLDRSPNALRPRGSLAYAALDEIKAQLAQNREPLWLVTRGRTEADIAQRLDQAAVTLEHARSNEWIAGFTLPTALWPRPAFQSANRAAAAQLTSQRETFRAELLQGGFNTNSFGLTESLLDAWQTAVASTNVYWPTNQMSRWILEKLVARPAGELFAVGFVYPSTNAPVTQQTVARWGGDLSREGFLVSGWELLGGAILERVQTNLWRVLLPMVLLILFSLWLAFRRPAEILLSLGVLLVSGLCLLAVMRTAGWSWNLMNLMALPLMLGTGVDYSIFMQLALRRHHGDEAAAHRSVGRALLLCGGTAMAGFGSLSWSGNAGMASLGEVCAVGVGFNMLISIYLLPVWWRVVARAPIPNAKSTIRGAQPSAFYRGGFWKLGVAMAGALPSSWCDGIACMLGSLYWRFGSRRREVVVQNLLPVLAGDRPTAERMTRNLFRQFGRKLADLWRYEAGLPVENMFTELTGWEHFTAAQTKGRGVLLLTPHLGNWEFGAPLLASRGAKLLVLTQAEPGDGFTEMRQAARARWGIDTMVVGQDAFAFIEIIKRLESGATVALLVDRPPAASAVRVELFGRSFEASIAAAELARASGCVLLPVVLPRTERGYAAQLLPEITYDRAALGKREGRQELTQQIMRAFEPAIRHHPDQWYHFVPLWP